MGSFNCFFMFQFCENYRKNVGKVLHFPIKRHTIADFFLWWSYQTLMNSVKFYYIIEIIFSLMLLLLIY